MDLSPSAAPAPAHSSSPTSPPSAPLSPPPVGDGDTSPPPSPQIAPLPPESSEPPPLAPTTPPAVTAPPPVVSPIVSPPPPQPPLPIGSPPPPLVEPPPPEATPSPAITPVSSPISPPEPPIPSVNSTSPPPSPTNPIFPPPTPPTSPSPEIPPSPPPPTLIPKTSPPPPPPPSSTTPIVPPQIPSSPHPKTPTTPTIPAPFPTRPNYPPLSTLAPPNLSSPPATKASPPSLSFPLASGSIHVSSKRSHLPTGLIAGCAIGGVFVLFLLGLLFFCYRERKGRRRTNSEHYQNKPFSAAQTAKNLQRNGSLQGAHVIAMPTDLAHFPPSRRSWSMNSGTENSFLPQAPFKSLSLPRGTFTYNELAVATNGFAEANLLGQGGFGYVYKGCLPNGKEVAVKRLKEGSKQGDPEFQAEVEIISRVHHKHLVSLVGYCITGSERLLVYEFVPNNTLEFHLHGSGRPVIEWVTRLRIAIGSAKGLAYLHEDCNPTIIHRDIKAANILLDDKFDAKLSDFGLAKSFTGSGTSITHISTKVVGTFGYLAPEYAFSGKLTEKSDVYSYGVMLLELITGRPPISATESEMKNGLVEWARPLLSHALEEGNFEGVADPRLGSNYSPSEMASMATCASACVRNSAWLRPRMSQVIRVLEGDTSANELNYGFNSLGDSRNNSFQYNEDLRTFNLTSAIQFIRGSSGTTSLYGLNPSSSSSDASSGQG